MPQNEPTISVVIVNYNVKTYLAQALVSIKKALADISHEIFVVDNASVDGSSQYIRNNFPEITLIENKENVGFSRANNQALKLVRGKFVVLINPDTVVQEDTFEKLLGFFDRTPEAAAATCKIINPDGTFSIDCRHSIPTPSIAFWKVTGLSRIFPKSKIFGQYNLTYLDPEQIYSVPAISGSFMMIKKSVLEDVGLFDEQFFMYCEDIDLCHRINRKNHKIFYVPTTQIIHYKGESTKKNNLDYVIAFNRSLYQFFKKYYAPRSVFLFRWLVTLGIFLRGIFIYLRSFFQLHFPFMLDMVILNTVLFFTFYFRIELRRDFVLDDFLNQFWILNVIATLLFLITALYHDVYPRHRFSVHSILKTNIFTFIFLAFLTFFLKQFAFSRIVVLITFLIAPLLMVSWRAILRKFYRGEKTALGKDLFCKPVVIIGTGRDVEELYQKFRARKDIHYEVVGWLSEEELQETGNVKIPNYLGTLKNLEHIIQLYEIRQVIFSASSISYQKILGTMSVISAPLVEFKLVPSTLEVMIGKSHIERLDDYPLVDIDYPLGKRMNRTSKRIFDLFFSAILLVLCLPFFLWVLIFQKNKLEKIVYSGNQTHHFTLWRFGNKSGRNLANLWLLVAGVFGGKISLVGAPLDETHPAERSFPLWYKAGMTGLVQINRDKIYSPEDAEKYHLYYLKNQSLFLDIEILLKALRRAFFAG